MATKTVVCPECAETVPYGRLACPACGSLLAVVAGGARRAEPLVSVPLAEPATLEDDPPPPPTPAPRVTRRRTRSQAATAAATTAAPASEAAPPAPAEGAAGEAATREAPPPSSAPSPPAKPAPAPRPRSTVPPMLEDWPADRPIPGHTDGPRPYEGQEDWDHAPAAPAVPAPNVPAAPAAPNVPPAPGAPAVAALAPASSRPAAAGSYLPPSASYLMGATSSAGGSAAVIGGGVYDGATASPMRAGMSASSPASSAPVTEPAPTVRAGSAPLLADLPFDAPDSISGWLVAAGSAVATASFLLPWADAVLGAQGSGYMSQWGLANGVNLLVFLATAVALALATVPNRIPAWLRSGVVAMVLGGLVLGLVWPYLFVSFTRFGSMVGAIGALLMLIGGALAVRPVRTARHGGDGTAV